MPSARAKSIDMLFRFLFLLILVSVKAISGASVQVFIQGGEEVAPLELPPALPSVSSVSCSMRKQILGGSTTTVRHIIRSKDLACSVEFLLRWQLTRYEVKLLSKQRGRWAEKIKRRLWVKSGYSCNAWFASSQPSLHFMRDSTSSASARPRCHRTRKRSWTKRSSLRSSLTRLLV